MDRCRCPEYEVAIDKLKIYTVGTYRDDAIKHYDRSGFQVTWIRHGVNYDDMKFTKPKATKIRREYGKPKDLTKIERMWCPYMTPVEM